MEEKNEEVEDIDSASSDSFIDDDENDEPSTSGQDDGTRIQVFFAALCFLLVTVKCYLSPFLIDKYTIFFMWMLLFLDIGIIALNPAV